MRIFKTKCFSKWAKKNSVSDTMLKNAAVEVSEKLYEANLGGFILKKRIATNGRGKRGSVRTIIAFKQDSHIFFVYGFEKNETANITRNEEKAFKIIAKELLAFSDAVLNKYVKENRLFEVKHEKKQNYPSNGRNSDRS